LWSTSRCTRARYSGSPSRSVDLDTDRSGLRRHAPAHILRAIGLVVLTATWFQCVATGRNHPARQSRRERALWQVRGCCRSPRTRGCTDDSARYLVDLARHGDDGVIGPMMEVATCGDPAIVDVLAPFLRELLTAQPRRFVRIVAGRPEAIQSDVVFAAVMQESESIDPGTATSVREVLQALGKERSRIGRAARRCLAEFERTTGGSPTR
jgi:hypothetical protein